MKTGAIRKCIEMYATNGLAAGRGAEAELTALEAEAELHDRLVIMQHERTIRASILWQKAHNRPDTIPDLGDLIEWLLTQIAAKDAALRTLTTAAAAYCCLGPPEPKPSLAEWGTQLEAVKAAITAANSALSPPTGKVLVDLEKLMEIEWTKNADGCYTCRACSEYGWVKAKLEHADDCWLAALLKDSHAAD